MNKVEILLVDDEAQIRKLLQINLESNGYKTVVAATGKEGLVLAANRQPDLILLDLGLPDMRGEELLGELRLWYHRPIIVLSVRNDETSIVSALDGGANDYLSKPFRSKELLARIRCALRQAQNSENHSVVLTFDDLELDLVAHTVKKNGELLKLTSTEYNLLVLFAKNEGRVLTHNYLLKEIRGHGYRTEAQYLRVFVATLRKKIETDTEYPKHIITENGVGYRFQ